MRSLVPIAATLLLASCGGNATVADQNSAATGGTLTANDVVVVPPEVDEAMNAGLPTPTIGNTIGDPSIPGEPKATDRYVGRWIGVEGMYLNVTATGGNRVRLEMQYDLKNKRTTSGTVGPEGITFTRGGKTLVLKPSNGNATGLKWLTGKTDCLTVASGEGYCRA